MGEQAKTAQCAIFAPRYPTKQGADRAEQAQAIGGDYATVVARSDNPEVVRKRTVEDAGPYKFCFVLANQEVICYNYFIKGKGRKI